MKLNFVSTLALFVALSVTFASCDTFEKRRIVKEGNEIIARVESFKKDTGRLPESLAETGLEETMAGPHYKKEDSFRYIVYDSLGFDSSYVYESATQKWEVKP